MDTVVERVNLAHRALRPDGHGASQRLCHTIDTAVGGCGCMPQAVGLGQLCPSAAKVRLISDLSTTAVA